MYIHHRPIAAALAAVIENNNNEEGTHCPWKHKQPVCIGVCVFAHVLMTLRLDTVRIYICDVIGHTVYIYTAVIKSSS